MKRRFKFASFQCQRGAILIAFVVGSVVSGEQCANADELALNKARAKVASLEKELAGVRRLLGTFHQGIKTRNQRQSQVRGKTWPAIPFDAKPLSTKLLPGREKLKVDRRRMLDFVVPDACDLKGIVVDNTVAKLVGQWQHSVHTPGFVGAGYIHDQNKAKGEKSVTYIPTIVKAGRYEIRMSHNANSGRSAKVKVTIHHGGGETVVHVNQHEHPPLGLLFRSLGRYLLKAGQHTSVVISNSKDDGGYVIADSMWFVPVELIGKQVPTIPKFDKQPRLTGGDTRKAGTIHLTIEVTERRLAQARQELAGLNGNK